MLSCKHTTVNDPHRDSDRDGGGRPAEPRFGPPRTFDVVDDGDDVLGEQLRRAAPQLRRLDVLEDGAELRIFLGGMQQIARRRAIFGQRRAEGTDRELVT